MALPLDRPLVCMVTGPSGFPRDGTLVERIADAARAGVHMVQVRARDLPDRLVFELARAAVQAVRGTRTRILVNDRPDVALAARAAGVHLREDSYRAPYVRQITPTDFVVGRSVHSVEGAIRAAADGGVDYLLFGTVFTSRSKPGRTPAGVDLLKQVVEAVQVPVLAIGGVSPETMGRVARTGAAGFAAIELFERGNGGAHFALECARRSFDTFRPVV